MDRHREEAVEAADRFAEVLGISSVGVFFRLAARRTKLLRPLPAKGTHSNLIDSKPVSYKMRKNAAPSLYESKLERAGHIWLVLFWPLQKREVRGKVATLVFRPCAACPSFV